MPQTADYQAYFQFLDRLGKTLEQLTQVEREKTSAVRADDLLHVNECMKKEQALSLSLRGLEQKRARLLANLGLSQVPLSRLAGACPPEVRAEAAKSVERLQGRFQVYQSAANAARTTLEINLHQIEKMMQEDPKPSDDSSASFTDIRA